MEVLRSFLVNTTTGVFLDVIFLFIYFIVLAAISTPLTLILIVALPIHLAIYQIYGPFLRKRLRSQFDAGANHPGRMVEDITGISAIKSLSAEKKARERLNDTLSASISAGYKVGMTQLFHQKTVFL
ncbi:MAG: ABC transporter transmembrane domain-containing protein, partial [Cohaesibacter sp.]|nr:ABC transporter transmembrane domain-containing protein [Cohaesibacter sp.]